MDHREHENFYSEGQFRESYQFYLGQISDSGRILYNSVMIFICAILVSLPFIHVNISVKAPGIIRPVSEKTIISSLVAGKVEKIHCAEGDRVHRGQVLITLNRGHLLNDLNHKQFEEMLLNNEITDLENLLASRDTGMVSVKYRLEYNNFQSKIKKVEEELSKTTKEKERYQDLYKEQFISDQEFDDLVYAESLKKSELEYLMNSTYNNWQIELASLQYTMNQIRAAATRLEKELEYCDITAPVSGYLEQFTGIYEGSNIQQGIQLASISPDTVLIGEIYITPAHIGTIQEGQEIIMIVDAFDYREWGTLHGIITDIPDDFILVDNQPLFKVKCKPDRDFLLIRNGPRGRLKKGMTFQARCLVTRKSISRLIVSRIDRRLNPSLSSQKVIIP
jgi:HlyD family secretion protein